MQKTILPFSEAPQLAKSDVAYATLQPELAPFYRYAPQAASFPAVIADKKRDTTPRTDLVATLHEQYAGLSVQPAVAANIEALLSEHTFTVTTAHQPALLLGPLFFIYKAITAINLAEMAERQAGAPHRVVPVFVLGSEDHDLDELNHAQLYGKILTWEPGETGAVGSMSTDTLAPVLEVLKPILGESEAAQHLWAVIARCYAPGRRFAAATQALLHELLGRFGLVVLDMNHPQLKRHFIPIMEAELTRQVSRPLVEATAAQLDALGFRQQAAPRDINLFYLQSGSRERIVLEDGVYKVLHTDVQFSQAEILAELAAHPERFSPNVILRPLYQELILPNLAYVGGGGELAYWLERKAQFEHLSLNFPMLVRRNSALWIDRDTDKRLQKLGFTPKQFFADTDALTRAYVNQNASGEITLASEISDLQALFDRLTEKAKGIDPTLEKAARADETKAIAQFEQWQGRLVRAEKQKHEVALNQLRTLKDKLFPNNGLQERVDNFIPYYLRYGDAFFDHLKDCLTPFDEGIAILNDPA